MMAELETGGGLAALLLSLNTLLFLVRKEMMSALEARDIVDQAILNLEAHEKLADQQSQDSLRSARAALQDIRARL